MSKRIVSVRVVTAPDDDPDLSYLDPESEDKDEAEHARERLRSYGVDWYTVGIYAKAEIATPVGRGAEIGNTVRSGGLWGIEDDSEQSHLDEIVSDELSELAKVLQDLGFPDAEITKAIEDAER